MSTKTTLLLSLIFLLLVTACEKEESSLPNQPLSFNDYDPARHLFSKASYSEQTYQTWETIIDIVTGDYDTIPGTKTQGGTIEFPIGSGDLTDFEGKRRIFRTLNGGNLLIQNLENLDQQTINLIELSNGERASLLPKKLTLGATNNIVYGWSNDDSIFRIDLSAGTVDYVVKQMNLPNFQNDYFLYLKDQHQLVIIGKNNQLDRKVLYIFDLDTEIISLEIDISESFGFVAHPDGTKFYGLTIPIDDVGFRLMKFSILDNQLNERMVSSDKLPIDNMSPSLQTIHTGTNAYICKGGSSDIENPTTILYSIDLNTGELKNEVQVHGNNMTLKLRAE